MPTSGTNGIPKELEAKLVEAKDWNYRHEQLKETIRLHGGSAQRNQEDLDRFDGEAREILEDIVEIVERTWGFA